MNGDSFYKADTSHLLPHVSFESRWGGAEETQLENNWIFVGSVAFFYINGCVPYWQI